jgi:predicted kinase
LPHLAINKSDKAEYPVRLDLKISLYKGEELNQGILRREVEKGNFSSSIEPVIFFGSFPLNPQMGESIPRFLIYEILQAPSKRLYLIRGASGSGKSTLARELAGSQAIAADDFPGLYEGGYNIELQSQAHQWCQEQCELSMKRGYSAIAVANTFSRIVHLQPYQELAKKYGYRVSIINCEGNYGNLHEVPEDVRERQLGLFDPLEIGGVKALEIRLFDAIKKGGISIENLRQLVDKIAGAPEDF